MILLKYFINATYLHSSQKYIRDNCTVMHTLNYKAYVTVVQINTHDAETVKQLKKKKEIYL